MTFLALTGSVPPRNAAPLEWIGACCLAAGLTFLYSPRISIIAVSVSAVFGILADPVFLGGQAFEWVRANVVLLAFSLVGTFIGYGLSRRLTAKNPHFNPRH